MTWRRLLYTGLLYLLLPYVLFHLLWRARRQPSYLERWGERFGFYGVRSLRPVIWIHTVSVGETRAAAPLIKALQDRHPDYQIVLTHMTPTGRETGEQLFGDKVLRCYLPYDYPFAVRSFLAHFRPCVGVLLETEIWPNLIHACREANVPLCLVNARLSEKSARRYRRFSVLVQESLCQLALVAAQTGEDARRLQDLGALAVKVTGNLKFDIVPPPSMRELGAELRVKFGENRMVFLAASTREGEEELILDALSEIDLPNLLVVIVPRHPQRFDAVAQLLTRHGIAFQRRGDDRNIAAETTMVLGDSMGEMFAYYAACDVAMIGGSLLPFGGQNLIEACATGKPVLVGPHTFNFAEAAQGAIKAGAALRVADEREMAGELSRLAFDAALRGAMGEAGLQFCREHQGATQHVMELLEHHLARSESP